MIFQGSKQYPVTEVVLHTSATPAGWWIGKTVHQMVDEIDHWHKGNGWRGIGYHRVFAPDGSIGIGRSIYDIGAHVAGHNRGTIGICMVPTAWVDRIGKPEDFYTDVQIEAVRAYIRELAGLTAISKVSGHNDYANKLCPGFKVQTEDWL